MISAKSLKNYMSIINCPNCKSTLTRFDKMLKCEQGHSFDFAKEGYVNLLLPNQKKKPEPGDSKLMMNAREAFLSTGHYDFLVEEIESTIAKLEIFSEEKETTHLLDLGCGSGYYTRNIHKDVGLNKIGIDISKAGVAKASKKDKQSTYLVGSVFDLPIADATVDVILNIFSPVHLKEVKRVLKTDGYFFKVIPAEGHMKEIAALIYDTIVPHQSTIESDLRDDLEMEVIAVETLETDATLAGADLHNLISMTPYLYKFGKGEVEKLKEIDVTFSFKVVVARLGG